MEKTFYLNNKKEKKVSGLASILQMLRNYIFKHHFCPRKNVVYKSCLKSCIKCYLSMKCSGK